MSLFRNESPNLGRFTTVNETGLTGASNSVTANTNLKPTTRHIIDIPLAAATVSGWIFQAPFNCKVLGARTNFTVASTSGVLTVEKIAADAIAPAAANGTTIVNVLTGTISLSTAANTRVSTGPSTATGIAATLNAGDQLAIFISGTMTNLAGGNLQVEIQQLA